MPFELNRGGPGILAMPGRNFAAPKRNFDGAPEGSSKPLISPLLGWTNTNITGTTVNPALAPIPFCTVDLFFSNTNTWSAQLTSGAAGQFTFVGPGVGPFFMRAVDPAGNPVGTTINGLMPS